ncbi:uncharacterized protein LOC129004413 [Macrosteles quadrilineatus]|uniref:uncharacterized protein LOC129004413 n=1 Tax=Macrosteles quadrilineatus TaxID=74068 RepID=UPI0023E2152C|nr:uncharacterized protein LOC129004413 [Macrosteles quadrilineatus]
MLLSKVLSHISLEPVMFLYFTTLALNVLSSQNLLLQKVCLGGTVAPPAGAGKCPDELGAQKEVTFIQTWRDLIVLVGPVVFVMFAGPWSDNHGRRRKPLLYLPIIGQIIADLLCALNVFFWSWSPAIAALSSSVPPALTGWRSCFQIGVATLVCDHTPEKFRLVKVGVCFATYFLASPFGAFVFGLIFHKVGYYGIYCLGVTMNLTAIVYLYLLIPENPIEGQVKLKVWEKLFDPSQVVQCFKTVLKPRDGYNRAILLLLIAVAPLTMAPLQGELAVLYFFLRYKFHWDAVDFGYYEAYKLIIIFFGTCLTLGVFSHMFGLSDATIGAMSMVTLIITATANAFAAYPWELFVFPIIDFMHGAGLAVVYSIISKIVDSSESGQANSMVGIAEALYPLINMPLYNQFYNYTFEYLPGAFFLLSVLYGILSFLIYFAIFILQKKTKQMEEEVHPDKNNPTKYCKTYDAS